MTTAQDHAEVAELTRLMGVRRRQVDLLMCSLKNLAEMRKHPSQIEHVDEAARRDWHSIEEMRAFLLSSPYLYENGALEAAIALQQLSDMARELMRQPSHEREQSGSHI